MSMDSMNGLYDGLVLSFRLNNQTITGVLNGSVSDWTFCSASAAFLRHFPSGCLHKSSLWTGQIPRPISKVYNGIWEAALKAGYDLAEREDEE